jgi:hypothetical protein
MMHLEWLALGRDQRHVPMGKKTKVSVQCFLRTESSVTKALGQEVQFNSNERIYMMNYIKSKPFQTSFIAFTSLSHCNFVHVLKFPLQSLFASYCYAYLTLHGSP